MSAGFDLDPRGAAALDEQVRARGASLQPPDPGLFEGAVSAAGKGLFRGLVAKPAVLAGDAATPLLEPGARAIDALLDTSIAAGLHEQRRRSREMLDVLKPDPMTTGMGAQVVDGLLDLGSSTVLYGPASAAIFEGYAQSKELERKGVDSKTAAAAGAVTAGATYVGVKLPLTAGAHAARSIGAAGSGLRVANIVARNVAYGAGANVSMGAAERGLTRDLLDARGFHKQAAQYEPFDRASVAIEAILGGAFSGAGSVGQVRADVHAERALQTALAIRKELHAALDSAPGVPSDAAASAAHRDALQQALAETLAGQSVTAGARAVEAVFLRRPNEGAGDAQRQRLQHLKMPEFGGVRATIVEQARAEGVDPALALAIASIETGGSFNPAAANPRSSARGLFQMIDATWSDLGGTAETRGDATTQARLGARFIARNVAALRETLGREPAAHEAYLAHLLGLDGARRVLAAEPQRPVLDVVREYDPHNAQAIVENNAMSGLSVGQAIERWKERTDLSLTRLGLSERAETPTYEVRIPADETLTAEQRQIERRFAEQLDMDLDESLRAYEAMPQTQGGRVLDVRLARELAPEYADSDAPRAEFSEALDGPGAWLLDRQFERLLGEPGSPGDRVTLVGGALDVRRLSALDGTRAGEIVSGARIVDASALQRMETAVRRIDASLAAGKDVAIVYGLRDPVAALVEEALPRAMREGRPAFVELREQAQQSEIGTLLALADRYRESDRVDLRVVEIGAGRGQPREVALEDLRSIDFDEVRGRLREALDREWSEGRVSETVHRAATRSRPAKVADQVEAGGAHQIAPDARDQASRGAQAADAESHARGGGIPWESRDGGADPLTTETEPGAANRQSQQGARTASARAVADADVEAARKALTADPDLRIALEDGRIVTASEVLAEFDEGLAQARRDAEGFDAAINCYLSTGN